MPEPRPPRETPTLKIFAAGRNGQQRTTKDSSELTRTPEIRFGFLPSLNYKKHLIPLDPRVGIKEAMIKSFRQHAVLLGNWHFHPQCSHWPKADYIEDIIPPDPKEVCVECMTRYNEERPKADRHRRAHS